MEFNDVISQRRAVREYTTQPLARDAIERLLKKAVLAPSAENHQPWEFAVSLDAQRIDQYSDRAKRWFLANPHTLTLDPALQHMLAKPHFSIFYHAPALIVVLAKSSASQAREDCCLAAATLLLAARDIGLGTCWIGLSRPWFELPEIKLELGIPRDRDIVAPIVVGYPLKWPPSHERNAPRIYSLL